MLIASNYKMVFLVQKFGTLTYNCWHLKNICRSVLNICKRGKSSDSSQTGFRLYLEQCGGGSVDLEKNNETGLAVITLNNPEKRNALTGKMMVELSDRIHELEEWEQGKGLVLRGAAGTFCSGADLSLVQQLDSGNDGFKMATFMQDVLLRCHRLPLISVALIDGRALGGGAEMCLPCDFRIMTETAKIGFVQIKLNITPGFGAATFLTKQLGPTKAIEILSMGQIIDAISAKEMGIVHHVLSNSGDVLQQTKEWLLSRHCKYDATVIRSLKRTITNSEVCDYEESLKFEKQIFKMIWFAPQHVKALSQKIKHD